MSSLKKIYYGAASFLPMSLFRSGGPAGLLLPYHHVVSDRPLAHIRHLYQYKDQRQFTGDLDFLLKHYQPVHPDALFRSVTEKTSFPSGRFLLTFDDGFREVYDIIAPILEKKGIPAIFFINPAFIDNRQLFYRCKISLLIDELLKNERRLLPVYSAALKTAAAAEAVIEALKNTTQDTAAVLDTIAAQTGYSFSEYAESVQPFLSEEQVKDLHKRGFTIGAHSMDHPYYKLLSKEEQVKQTIDSCNYVKKLTGTAHCHFSFPHSDEDIMQGTINLINEYNPGLLFGIQNQKNELRNRMLHRFNAERPGTDIAALVKGQLLLTRFRQLTGKNLVKRIHTFILPTLLP